MKISPHALTSMRTERDQYQAIANRYKVGSIERWQADERVKQLDVQIARIEDRDEPSPMLTQKPFLPICAACGQESNGRTEENPCPACGRSLNTAKPKTQTVSVTVEAMDPPSEVSMLGDSKRKPGRPRK